MKFVSGSPWCTIQKRELGEVIHFVQRGAFRIERPLAKCLLRAERPYLDTREGLKYLTCVEDYLERVKC